MIGERRIGAAQVLRGAAPLTLLGVVVVVLLRFPPEQSGFYPRCPIYDSLHVLCPGCGATRALAALLHGQLGEAMRYNALTTLLFPIAVAYGLRAYQHFLRRGYIRWPEVSPAAVYATLALAVVFTVVRNLPFAPSR